MYSRLADYCWDVLGWLGAGMTADEIPDDYPDLEKRISWLPFSSRLQFAHSGPLACAPSRRAGGRKPTEPAAGEGLSPRLDGIRKSGSGQLLALRVVAAQVPEEIGLFQEKRDAMTVALNLPPDVERAFLAEAEDRGVSLDDWVREVLIARMTQKQGSFSPRRSRLWELREDLNPADVSITELITEGRQ